MDGESLANPLQAVSVLLELVFVVGILEVLGLIFYSAVTAEAALDTLMGGGPPTPTEAVQFVLASPDRIVVAAVLALIGAVPVLVLDESWEGGGAGGGV